MRAAVVEALGQQMDSSALQPVLRTLRQAVRALATMPVLLACSAPLHAQEVIEYYGTDHLGSVRVVFNAAGTVISRADYLPYGEEVFAPTGPMPAQQFTGQARDGEAGQDYFHARMYQPRTGRFNAVDPVYAGLFDPQKWNRYTYAKGNSLTFIDPFGLDPCRQSDGAKYCPPDSQGPSSPPRFETTVQVTAKAPILQTSLAQIIGFALASIATGPPSPGYRGPDLGQRLATSTFPGAVVSGVQAVADAEGAGETALAAASLALLISPPARVVGTTGKLGEKVLQQLGGESQVFFRTSQGARYIDQLVDGIGMESKVGYTSLTTQISRQIAKDVELMRTGQVNGIQWHFFPSPVTGQSGPSGPLASALRDAGIQIVRH